MVIVLAALLVAGSLSPPGARAADREFVGVLAWAVEDDVAEKLGLSDGQREKLLELIDVRESDVVDLAMSVRDASPEEREAKLAPFRRESEERGLALLTDEQRAKLEQIRLQRLGLSTLGDEQVAQRLGLSDEQREKVDGILKQRTEQLAGAEPDAAHTVRAETERQLAAVLTGQQKAAWEALAAGESAASPVEGESAASPAEGEAEAESAEPAGPAVAMETEAGAEAEPPSEPAEPTAESTEPTAEPAEPAAEPAEPGAELATEPAEPAEPAGPVKLQFSFRYQPWADVLDWFAEQAGLSLVLDAPPPGTLNYTDDRQYTPAEAIDLLNSVLLTKGFTLVRRERMLMLINLEDGIPPNLVTTVPVEELDDRGEFELVSVLFQLEKADPEEAEAEVSKLVGPQGSVVLLPAARQLFVTETAGKLRTIRKVLQTIEDPEGLLSSKLQTFELEHVPVIDALEIVRQLLDIPPEENATADGSLRFTLDPAGTAILATGKPEMLAKLDEILLAIDVPGADPLAGPTIQETPQLEVYPIDTADPESVLQVMQTLLAGSPDVRLALDPKTGNLVAMARPSEHATIRATLDQMQADARQVEVIQLHTVDPQLAVLSINKLFGAGEEGAATAPKVDAEPVTRQLLVRGSVSQIEQIRTLLEKMGERETGEEGVADGGTVRMLPLSGRSARSALEKAQEIWPTMRKNKIRVVTPSAVIPTMRPGSAGEAPPAMDPLLEQLLQPDRIEESAPAEESPPPEQEPREDASTDKSAGDDGAGQTAGFRPRLEPMGHFLLVSQLEDRDETDGAAPTPADQPAGPPVDEGASAEPPPIIVAPGPGGIMIACEDTEALDEFEDLLNALAGGSTGGTEMTIFYLKHATASVVAETLDRIFGGGTLAGGGGEGGGGSLLGDIAGAALGDAGGGILGSLLGLGGEGGTIAPTGSLQITPDNRLNALIVQANPADLDTIQQLLEILDQKESPEEILVKPRPRLIPVFNTQAEEIARIVGEVYRDRMISSSAEGRPPTPQELVQMFRGGRRGQGGSQGASSEDVQKMSIGVDARTNSLIVSAPDSLFQEVKELVQELDQAAVESNQAVEVITLHRASPEAVQQAISAITGESVRIGRTQTAAQPTTAQPAAGQPGQPAPGNAAPNPQDMQRRMEFLRRLQQGGQSGRSSRRGR